MYSRAERWFLLVWNFRIW